MYLTKLILAFVLAAGASAAAITPRQNQDACDQGRAGVVNALKEINTSSAQIQDATVKQAVQSGLQQSAGGVQQIGQAIKAGQAPPAAGRDEVQAGFEAMNAAIISANAADPAVASTQTSLNAAIAAGVQVVQTCAA
ncbi:hypothetical protein Daus18300_000658 [Diaporthe australafricana]|uniref:Cell wall protein n=1 Tax=Diaporthe australafricana TaxID=127596 RepID=A0ABR3Y1L4_9PEZI